MLGSSSGIEREQAFPTEIRNYPAIVHDNISELVTQIQARKKTEATEFLSINDTENAETLITRLDDLILDIFGLSQDDFIDYALTVQVPTATNQLEWEQVDYEVLCKYAKVFIDYFSRIFADHPKFVSCNIYMNMKERYCAAEIVIHDHPLRDVYTMVETQNQQMCFLNKFRLNEVNELFYQDRDAIVFSENSFYILKTNEAKNWHTAMAKLDLSDVIDAIFQGSEVIG
jgi:hypothetical protein